MGSESTEGERFTNLGAGRSGLVLVEQHGPFPPPGEAVDAANAAIRGRGPLPVPCLDCAPNLVLTDSFCTKCREWEWGVAVAHDETCPALLGITNRTQD